MLASVLASRSQKSIWIYSESLTILGVVDCLLQKEEGVYEPNIHPIQLIDTTKKAKVVLLRVVNSQSIDTFNNININNNSNWTWNRHQHAIQLPLARVGIIIHTVLRYLICHGRALGQFQKHYQITIKSKITWIRNDPFWISWDKATHSLYHHLHPTTLTAMAVK